MARIPVLQTPGRQDAVIRAATWIATGHVVDALGLDGVCAILPSAVAV
jgi:hypothetical protein